MTIRILATSLLLMLASCFVGENNENGFRTSEPNKMAQLKVELSARGIPFREDDRGFIMYDKKYKESFEAIRDQLSSEMAMKFEDPVHNALALKVLADMGIQGRIDKRQDGEWVAWHPRSNQEGRESQERIHEAFVASMQSQRSEECTQKSASATVSTLGHVAC